MFKLYFKKEHFRSTSELYFIYLGNSILSGLVKDVIKTNAYISTLSTKKLCMNSFYPFTNY